MRVWRAGPGERTGRSAAMKHPAGPGKELTMEHEETPVEQEESLPENEETSSLPDQAAHSASTHAEDEGSQPAQRHHKKRAPAAALLLGGALLLVAGAAALTHLNRQAPSDPTGFLKWSMEHYQRLSGFQADCDWSENFGVGAVQHAKRTLLYARPNRFKVAAAENQMTLTAVSDGKTALEYSNQPSVVGMSSPAPDNISETKMMTMQHPMFCGSLLYQFFGGPNRLASLVNTTKGAIRFGDDVTLDGVKCRTVKFVATG